VIQCHREALGFMAYMPDDVHLEVIKHLNYAGAAEVDGVPFRFFKKQNHFWSI
jgi:hypothetical protein